MAELKNTFINGSIAAKKVYENGQALSDKFGAGLGFSDGKLQLKNENGSVISSVDLPGATITSDTLSIESAGEPFPSITVTKGYTGDKTLRFTGLSLGENYFNFFNARECNIESIQLIETSEIGTIEINESTNVKTLSISRDSHLQEFSLKNQSGIYGMSLLNSIIVNLELTTTSSINYLYLHDESRLNKIHQYDSSSVEIEATPGTKTVYNTWQISEDSNGSLILKKA